MQRSHREWLCFQSACRCDYIVGQSLSEEVGAVFCLEASRLARNGRDWHHLIELCGMVDAVLADPDGIYDPMLLNDRLLLGLAQLVSTAFHRSDSSEGAAG